MTGILPKRQILRILPLNVDYKQTKSIEHVQVIQILQIEKLQTVLNEMHKDVQKRVSKHREQSIRKRDTATNILAPSFAIGDFILVRRAVDNGHKLRFRWFGPCRISAVHNALVYSMTTLSNLRTERVHAARLIKYNDSLHGTRTAASYAGSR